MTQFLKKTKSELIIMISDLFNKYKNSFSRKDLLFIYFYIEKMIEKKKNNSNWW